MAYETGRVGTAADLLVDVTGLDGLSDPGRFQAAFTGLLSAGRLFDAIDLLRQGVALTPTDNERRRLLYDLLVASEQHLEADQHRQILIRNRVIDEELLFSTYRSVQRNEEVDSLKTIYSRNPADTRPLIGEAKLWLDTLEHSKAIATLQRIVKSHPEYVSAQAMLGRALVASGDYAMLPGWANQLPDTVTADPDYWLTLGDWALQSDKPTLAMNAYGNAAMRGFDRMQPRNKLAALSAGRIAQVEFELIRDRAAALTKLSQGYAAFKVRSKESADSIRHITAALLDLGKVWEAEAWVAYGTTLTSLSESEQQSLTDLRQRVLSQLGANTPWQQTNVLPTWVWLDAISPDLYVATISQRSDENAVPKENHTPRRRRPLGPLGRPLSLKLQDEAISRNLEFFGRTADDLSEPGINNFQMIGCGGGTIDFDLDGWPDLYMINAGGRPLHDDSNPNAMFRNLSGRFKNVSSQSGGGCRGFGQGVAVGDINEDGFDDLLVLNYGPNRLWINHGDGTFSDQPKRWLPANSAWPTSAAIADIDGDNLADAYVVNYCAGSGPKDEPCYSVKASGPRTCSPIHYSAEPDIVLKGLPNGRFQNVTRIWNADPDLLGRGLGIVAGSFDKEPGVDLFIANDMTTNHYWSRRRSHDATHTFALEESAILRGLATDGQSRSQGSMGIAAADLNQDGTINFYVTNFDLEHNTVYLSRGPVSWRDQTIQSELYDATVPMVGFGTQAIDFDNNGDHELVVVNGHVDHFIGANGKVFYEQPAQLFQRNQQRHFESIGLRTDCSYFLGGHVGRGLWIIDANQDGNADVVATHQTEPTALLINKTESPYSFATFKLVATRDSRSAVGSVVTIRFDDFEATYTLNSGDGFLCSNERIVHVGLGERTTPIDVTVTWLGGALQTWPSLPINRQWLLVQDEAAFDLTTGQTISSR